MVHSLKGLALALLICNSFAFAYDFSAADAAYGQRENNASAINNAKRMYRDGLNSASKQDKIYAAKQLGKLAYYEGELLLSEEDHSKRVELFTACMDDIDKIKPDVIGERTAPFYLFKGMCLAFWGKSAPWYSAMWRVGEIKQLIQDGLDLDANYEGGDMHRLYAGVYSKGKPGLNDLEGSLQHIETALQLGPSHYNAYLIKADILKAMGRTDEAITMLSNVSRKLKQMIRSNNLPVGMEPETKAISKRIIEKLDQL